jgi:uncharacterized protein (DUF58 family)
MSDHPRVSFEFTLDELVDSHLRLVRRTREGASWRWRESRNFVVAASIPLLCIVGYQFSVGQLSPAGLVALVIASIVLAVILAVPFLWYYDHIVRRRLRRYLVERSGGPGPYTCTVELRPEGVSVDQNNVRMNFPWADALSIEDSADGIEIRFRGGQVLARSRGFASPEARGVFLTRVHELAPPAARPRLSG